MHQWTWTKTGTNLPTRLLRLKLPCTFSVFKIARRALKQVKLDLTDTCQTAHPLGEANACVLSFNSWHSCTTSIRVPSFTLIHRQSRHSCLVHGPIGPPPGLRHRRTVRMRSCSCMWRPGRQAPHAAPSNRPPINLPRTLLSSCLQCALPLAAPYPPPRFVSSHRFLQRTRDDSLTRYPAQLILLCVNFYVTLPVIKYDTVLYSDRSLRKNAPLDWVALLKFEFDWLLCDFWKFD